MTYEVWKDPSHDGPLHYFVYVPGRTAEDYFGLDEFCDVLVIGVPIQMAVTAKLEGKHRPQLSSRNDRNIKFRMVIGERLVFKNGPYIDAYGRASRKAAEYNVKTLEELEV